MHKNLDGTFTFSGEKVNSKKKPTVIGEQKDVILAMKKYYLFNQDDFKGVIEDDYIQYLFSIQSLEIKNTDKKYLKDLISQIETETISETHVFEVLLQLICIASKSNIELSEYSLEELYTLIYSTKNIPIEKIKGFISLFKNKDVLSKIINHATKSTERNANIDDIRNVCELLNEDLESFIWQKKIKETRDKLINSLDQLIEREEQHFNETNLDTLYPVIEKEWLVIEADKNFEDETVIITLRESILTIKEAIVLLTKDIPEENELDLESRLLFKTIEKELYNGVENSLFSPINNQEVLTTKLILLSKLDQQKKDFE